MFVLSCSGRLQWLRFIITSTPLPMFDYDKERVVTLVEHQAEAHAEQRAEAPAEQRDSARLYK